MKWLKLPCQCHPALSLYQWARNLEHEKKRASPCEKSICHKGNGAGKLPVPGHPATFAYSRARACCACSRCGTGGLYFFFIFHLSSLSNVLSFGRLLNMTEILLFRLLNPSGSCRYCQGRPRLVLINCLEGLSLPRNSATINWPARHDFVADWTVKLWHKNKGELQQRLKWACTVSPEHTQYMGPENASDRESCFWPFLSCCAYELIAEWWGPFFRGLAQRLKPHEQSFWSMHAPVFFA